MGNRIADIIIAGALLLYIFIKHKNNLDWYLLVVLWLSVIIGFDVLVILRSTFQWNISAETLNIISRAVRWFGVGSIAYYAFNGEKP